MATALSGCDGCDSGDEGPGTTTLFEEGETTGDGDGDPEANPDCTPSIGSGVVYTCEGTGVGGATLDVQGEGLIFRCVTAPGQTTPTGCAENPLDLAEVYTASGEAIAEPAACCLEEPLEPANVSLGCVTDCAYAACKWAALKLRNEALALPSDCSPILIPDWACELRADLFLRANELETSRLQECVDQVVAHPGEVVSWAMGSTMRDVHGSPDNVTLYLGCDITDEVADEPPVSCDAAAHTVPPPNFDIDPVFVSAVTYAGLYGSGSTAILDDDYTVYAPACGSPPCFFELSEFDLQIDDVAVGDYLFESINLSLDEIAGGTRTGTDVTIAEGDLMFNLSVVVSVDGDYLYGTAPHNFVFVNTDDVEATYSGGVFTVQYAEFDYGDIVAVLNTDLPVAP
jgi:hypothetical protein